MEPLFENRYQQVNREGDCDLGAHRIFARAVESFDSQMLFDPFEEQFDLPAQTVDLSHRQCWQVEIVGQKHQRVVRVGIVIADAANDLWIGALNVKAVQHDGLIETQTGALVDRARITSAAAEILPSTRHEESLMLVDAIQSSKIQIGSVHDVERAGLEDELVQNIDIVDAARRDNKYGGDVSLQAEQGVQLDAALASSESGPGKQRQAQVDGGGVQRISSLLELGRQRLVRVESGSLLNEELGKVAEDAPIARLVGIGQGAAGGRLANATVVEFGTQSAQARFDIAQTLAPGQLSKRQHDELFVSGQFADAEIAAIPLNTLVEFVFGQAITTVRLIFIRSQFRLGKIETS